MLYLARVYQNLNGAGATLKLLAQKRSSVLWEVLKDDKSLSLSAIPPELGSLVLVEMHHETIVGLEDATHWITDLVQDYLTLGMTPDLLKEEVNKVETWRQELTLKSQDLERRTVELEARLCQQDQAMES